VMEKVPGHVIRAEMPDGYAETPAEKLALTDALVDVLADLHTVDPEAIGLGGYGRPHGYLERQIRRWNGQWEKTKTHEVRAVDELGSRLARLLPESQRGSIVHGDYRLDNVMFDATEPRAIAVLDWELSTIGHPLADFSYHCMSWRIPPGQFRGLGGVDIAALGIPDEKSYVRRYCERTGRIGKGKDADVVMADWNFYLAYNMFRLAGILQGIAKRVEMGTASSAQARQAGAGARPLAEMGWALARLA